MYNLSPLPALGPLTVVKAGDRTGALLSSVWGFSNPLLSRYRVFNSRQHGWVVVDTDASKNVVEGADSRDHAIHLFAAPRRARALARVCRTARKLVSA